MARIVVADNDLDALDLALTDLRLEGHEVYGALDAADAEALVGTVSPDVVVLDYRMPPGITGLELAERLVTDDPDLRVVIYSNYQRVELRARAAKIGVPFLAKGNLRALRAAVLPGVSEQYRVQRRWEGPAAVMVVALVAAVAVILIARDHAGLQAEREARAAAADAVFPVDDAMRTAMTEAASGTAPRGASTSPSPTARRSASPATSPPVPRTRASRCSRTQATGSWWSRRTTPRPRLPRSRNAARTSPVSRSLPLGPAVDAERPAALARRHLARRTGPDDRVPPRPATLRPGVVRREAAARARAGMDADRLGGRSPGARPGRGCSPSAILLAGVGAASWLVRRDDRSRRSQRELVRLQEASATTAALATVAQHSLDLADFLPALTNELAAALGLQGLSLAAPSAAGERQFFAWGVAPATVPASSMLPADAPGRGDPVPRSWAGAGGRWPGSGWSPAATWTATT